MIAGMVNSFRAANPTGTAFVAAGDLIGASTFTSFIQNDEPTLDVLKSMGLAVSSLGNHEFDQGRADLDNRVIPYSERLVNPDTLAPENPFDWIAANLYDTATNLPAYQEYTVIEFGAVSVGFIGAVTEDLPSLVSPAGIATLDVRPIVPEVNRVAEDLSDGDPLNGEADVVVLMVHEGAATIALSSSTDNSKFGQIVNGASADIDAIYSSHTHLRYDHDILIPNTTTTRPVYSAGQYGEAYARLAMSIDPDTAELLSIDATVSNVFTGFTPDPVVAGLVASAVAVAAVAGSVPLGNITADFNRGVQINGTTENRGAESTLGNFVADVQLAQTEDLGAAIAFMNPGGLRQDLKFLLNPSTLNDANGRVTFAEAAAVQPFANTLFTMDLTTAQIKAVLEQQWQPVGAARPFLKLGVSSTLKYSYNAAATAGNRIRDIYVDDVLAQPGDVFRVVANSFLNAGGDNFGAFTGGTNKADSGKIDLQSMVDYFKDNSIESPDLTQRAIGVALSAPDADGYSARDSVTLTLSSLLFTRDGARAGTVVVSANGVDLGSATIDPTIVDTTDEVGRASVTITIPEGTRAGSLTLTVRVPESGSTIDVPITTTFVPEPITSLSAPVISGTAKVGRVLSASGGTWSVESPVLAYQWLRDGVAIAGATAPNYRLIAADAGSNISVAVTASKTDFIDAVATSAATKIAKLDSVTFASAPLFTRSGSGVNVSTTVRAGAGVSVTGDVTVFDGRRQVATGALGTNGRVTINVTGLSRGIHIITVRYAGNAQVSGSTSFPQLLIVW